MEGARQAPLRDAVRRLIRADGLPDGLVRTLALVAGVLDGAVRPWWLIGSAAMRLHGAAVEVADVDVLLSAEDAERAAMRLPGVERLPPAPPFRSDPFLRWTEPPLAVEFMADFHVLADGAWQRIAPVERQAVTVAGQTLFVPGREDLKAMCRLFGRPKDRLRLARL